MKKIATLALLLAAAPAFSAALPEAAKIDTILAKEWQKNGLQPNAPATDEVFLRRIYVDIIGRIPTTEEARAFLEDKSPDKRAKLIDQLLASDGYVANFYNYFADILRLQTDTKGALTGWAYADWLKTALKKNQTWDSMVTELLTTDGSSWNSGAIGFYMRDQGMQLDHLAATVQIFLGTQIVCAQCHNHPFDKWSQMDYYQMAAFTYGMDSKKGYNLDFGKTMKKEDRKSANAEQLRKDFRSVKEVVGEVTKTLRYTTITETDRLPKLPHDYKYPDAKPGDTVQAKTMFGHEATPMPGETRIDAFAKWMTSSENPRFTTVIANRLWKRAMGIGVIEPVDELTDSTTPSNGELMSYLEKLMIEKKYDMKAYLRVIFNSDVYQRMPARKDVALGETYHFTGPIMRRLSAEQLWDSVATMIKGNVDHEAILVNEGAEKKLDALGHLYDALTSKSPTELVAQIKASTGGSEKEARIRELTDKAAELRREGKKEEAQKLSKQVNELRGSTKKDAFTAVLGEEGAREFQKEYRESGVKSKGGGKTKAPVKAMSRAEIQKIMAEAGGDKAKARELIDAAQKRAKQSAALLGNTTRASDLPSPSPRGHMLRIFGQSDRETIENSSREATVPQALVLLNGPVADALINENSAFAQQMNKAVTPEAKMESVYLGLLTRKPTTEEMQTLKTVMAERGDLATADVVHALLNTSEFLFVK